MWDFVKPSIELTNIIGRSRDQCLCFSKGRGGYRTTYMGIVWHPEPLFKLPELLKRFSFFWVCSNWFDVYPWGKNPLHLVWGKGIGLFRECDCSCDASSCESIKITKTTTKLRALTRPNRLYVMNDVQVYGFGAVPSLIVESKMKI